MSDTLSGPRALKLLVKSAVVLHLPVSDYERCGIDAVMGCDLVFFWQQVQPVRSVIDALNEIVYELLLVPSIYHHLE